MPLSPHAGEKKSNKSAAVAELNRAVVLILKKTPPSSINTDRQSLQTADNHMPLCGSISSFTQFLKKSSLINLLRICFCFDLAHSSHILRKFGRRSRRKSSQAASSCCHCQKQSELLGLHSCSRSSREEANIQANFLPVGSSVRYTHDGLLRQIFVGETSGFSGSHPGTLGPVVKNDVCNVQRHTHHAH